MKITKTRLMEIIKEEIQDFKTEQNIRKQIREFITTSTVAGAKPRGYVSPETAAAQTDYDTKSADYETAQKAYSTAVANRDDSKKYRQADNRGFIYSATLRRGFSLNPDWTTQNNDVTTKGGEKLSTAAAKNSASGVLDTEREADLQKTVATQKPPVGMGSGAGFGKGKAAGTGKGKASDKGKGKKGKDKKEK